MRAVSQEIRARNRDSVSGETGFSSKCRTCRVPVCECALTSGQRKVSRTGIDGYSLPVERPANCPPTSLSSALLPKLFSEESIDTDTRVFRLFFQHLCFSSCQATYVSPEYYCKRSF